MIEVNRATLDNGLRIVHCFDPGAVIATVDILYDVGSRDENSDMTGIAHLFEHLMFGGSINIDDYDTMLSKAGGKSNAWTSQDFTNFYNILPVENIETAFWLESDRMLSLKFSDKALQVQRSVVIEEFKQRVINRPYGDFLSQLESLVFTVHPYRFPTIGRDISHIEKITQDDIRRWFFFHYAPNNAILSVVGDINFDKVVELAKKWMEDIPRRDIKPRCLPEEPQQTSPREKTITANVPNTRIAVAYPMPAHSHPDFIVADVITDILSEGRSSRYYRNLTLPDNKIISAEASISATDDRGYLMLTALLHDNSPEAASECRQMLINEANNLCDGENSLSEQELQRAINQYEAKHTFQLMDNRRLAERLAICELQNEDINDIIDRRRRIKVDDIKRVYKSIVNPQKANTLYYYPSHT